MDYNPSPNKACHNCPVGNATWGEAVRYCNKLSKNEGLELCYTCFQDTKKACRFSDSIRTPYSCKGYRLPTEAEWEYAARAGTTTTVYSGVIIDVDERFSPSLNDIAWHGCFRDHGPRKQKLLKDGRFVCGPHPVAQKEPNAWGLFDMLGNVFEWCHDVHHYAYHRKMTTDPWGLKQGPTRVSRGGAWLSPAREIRAADRGWSYLDATGAAVGFRPARTFDDYNTKNKAQTASPHIKSRTKNSRPHKWIRIEGGSFTMGAPPQSTWTKWKRYEA